MYESMTMKLCMYSTGCGKYNINAPIITDKKARLSQNGVECFIYCM